MNVSSIRPAVLFAIPTMRAGGAERVFSTLLRHIDQAAFDVSLAVFDANDAMLLGSIPNSVRLINLQARRVREGLRAFVALLHRLKPDVVVSTLEHLNGALCLTRVAWPRGTKHVLRLTHVLQVESALGRLEASLLYRTADAIVFQSEHMRDVYSRRLVPPLRRTVVIPNPVDVAAVRSAAAQDVDLGYDPAAVNLVGAGALEQRKGFDMLIEALSALDRRVCLTLLGDGPERSALAGRAASVGLGRRLRLLGLKQNPYPFFAAADAFVLSSRTEGSPNVVFEALACGTPVISTPVAGLEKLFGGQAGISFASAPTVGGLARALATFVDSDRRRPDADAIAGQDVHSVVPRWEELIRRLA